MKRTLTTRCAGCLFVVSTMAGVAHAEQGAATGASPAPRIEFAGFGGTANGLTTITSELSDAFADGLRIGGLRNVRLDEGSSVKWLVGGSVGVGIGRNLLVTGDVLFNRLANPSFTGTALGQTLNVSMTTVLSEYVAGVQYLFMPGRITPYAAAGFGVVRLSANVDSGDVADISISESDITSNYGGGIRFAVGGNWAIRPDFRIVHVPDETFFRTSVAAVYQLR